MDITLNADAVKENQALSLRLAEAMFAVAGQADDARYGRRP